MNGMSYKNDSPFHVKKFDSLLLILFEPSSSF